MNFSLEAVKMAMIWTFDKIQDSHHSSKMVISKLEKMLHTHRQTENRELVTEKPFTGAPITILIECSVEQKKYRDITINLPF